MVLFTLSITAASAWPLKWADEDQDSVPDRRDDCLSLPETINGYADDDGCPDYLEPLAVVGRLDGEDVPVAVSLELQDGTLLADWAPGPRVGDPLAPGTRVTIRARVDCLAGVRRWSVRGGGANLVAVPLAPRFDATVRWAVVDEEGAAVADATVEWLDARTAACAPPSTPVLVDGIGAHELGAGVHRVRVSAPGFRAVEHDLEISRGERLDVQVLLESTADEEAPEPE